MMTEDDELRIDLRKLFPEAAKRVEILEKLKDYWHVIVRQNNARYSEPVALGVDYLTVWATNDNAIKNIANMKGTILRGLKRLGYDAGENFTVRINARESHENLTEKSKRVKVNESEEKLRQYMSNSPDTLPEDINFALSHLMMYIDGRKAG